MKSSELIILSKREIAKNSEELESKYEYICYAINGMSSKGDEIAVSAILCIIRRRLSPYATLEGWLHGRHNIPILDDTWPAEDKVKYMDKIQSTRHAWLDSLIAEFQSRGN
jgi:hypothetical protein